LWRILKEEKKERLKVFPRERGKYKKREKEFDWL